ncbi:LytR C-terminal domain-containing protein [Sanguibacter sp. A247]|uniref:LytR C-terminal domain-containing protein n=1 Tax=unclassified Sanguibacter TaxID=2645534 RepID=UPI003FD776CC
MTARFTPEQARALRRRREHERQTVIFGVLIAALAIAGLTGVAAFTGNFSLPGSSDFVSKEPEGTLITWDEPCAPPKKKPAGRAKIKVTVLNGTTRAALATTVAEDLLDRGFAVEGSGNDERRPRQTLITSGPSGIVQAYTVRARFPGARLVLDDRPGKSVDVTIGAQFTTITPEEAVTLDPKAPVTSVEGCVDPAQITPQPAPARFDEAKKKAAEKAAKDAADEAKAEQDKDDEDKSDKDK